MEKIELEYLLEALNYGLNDCVDLNGNTETHYNQFANAVEVVQNELNLLNIPVVSNALFCGNCKEEHLHSKYLNGDLKCDNCNNVAKL
jgi:hypothetical protein